VASVTIGGTPFTFSNVAHSYDVGNGEVNIIMTGSAPANWEIQIILTAPDSDPGTVDTCNDFLFVNVFDDLGNWFLESACVNDVTVVFNTYETTPGNCTSGTFDGVVEDIGTGSTLTLTGGVFDALRQ
jgi:hypothetical protein